MKENKPFKLRPSGKDYIWGGQRLNTEFQKNIDMNPLAETWECSTHPDGPSYVMSGESEGMELSKLIESNPNMLGLNHCNQDSLPILVKLIDAKENLSVQVHPSDEFAYRKENGQKGKTEMWYILDAKDDAHIVCGLSKPCTKDELKQAVKTDALDRYLNKVRVHKGEVYYIPAGTIHAIGAGCLIVEIQENSDLTYRLYDYGRKGKDGKNRPLHIDKAIENAICDKMNEPRQVGNLIEHSVGIAKEYLAGCEYFDVYRITIDNEGKPLNYHADELNYRVLICTNGKGRIEYINGEIEFRKGECVFIPADSVEMRIIGNAELLDIRG